jgi:hypothetical protein
VPGRRTRRAVAVAGALACFACDDAIYAPGEVLARDRFQAIALGTSETDLRARLGAPICVVEALEGTGRAFTARCPEASPPQPFEIDDPSTWPPDLWGLSEHEPMTRVLVYRDGTVAVSYFVDPHGRVQFVRVVIS